jgi:AcrR family transcriptional regulator
MTGGRPRNSDIDEAARAAARQLLVEAGWEGTTLSAVADRAGVSRPALYRRWPTKTHLVFDALFGWGVEALPKDADEAPQAWLSTAIETSFALFADPAVRAGAPGLLAVLATDDDLRTTLWEGTARPVVERIEQYLDGVGDADQRAALAQAVLAVIAGAPLFLELFGSDRVNPRARAALAALVGALANEVPASEPPPP